MNNDNSMPVEEQRLIEEVSVDELIKKMGNRLDRKVAKGCAPAAYRVRIEHVIAILKYGSRRAGMETIRIPMPPHLDELEMKLGLETSSDLADDGPVWRRLGSEYEPKDDRQRGLSRGHAWGR